MSSGRGVLILTDWLPPDFGAVGQYALQDARQLAAQGQQVELVGFSSTRPGVEVERPGTGELRILRLPSLPYARDRWVERALWTATAHEKLLGVARRRLAAVEEVHCSESPPFLIHRLAPLARRAGVRLVYRLTDFYPEVLWAGRGGPPAGLGWLARRADRLRRTLDRIEVLGEDARERLLEARMPPERIVLRRDASPVPIRGDEAPLPRPASLAGKVVLLYSGNFGVAHEERTLLDGLTLHHRTGSGRVGLWLNATGAKADALAHGLEARKIPHHRSHPVPLAQLPSLLRAADVHLITLRNEFVGLVLPSKVYAILALGGPLLFVGSARSDVARLARERLSEDRFWRVEVGDEAGLARALEEIADSVER